MIFRKFSSRLSIWVGIGVLPLGPVAQADPAPSNEQKLPAQWSITTGGCKVWNPDPQLDETVEWTGSCVDGYVDGEGSLRWYKSGVLNEDHQISHEKMGHSRGRSLIKYQNGDVFDGQNENDAHNGYGVYHFHDGGEYKGYWSSNKFSGSGERHYANGSVYVGQFKDGRFDGRGIVTYSDGTKYDGLWIAGKHEGYGEYTAPDGRSYKGEWHLGKEHGRGVKVYSDGSIYKGQFSEGKRSGQGEFNYALGTLKTYTGYWINDKREGRGILLQRDGATYVGEFRDDAINGEGTAIYPDGSKYIGQFVNGEMHGYGTRIWSNGVKYQGQWVDGKESGGGVYYDAKGNVMRTNRAGSVQLVNEQGVFKVPVTINDSVNLSFIVDSGAADVSIPVDVVLVMFRSGTLASTDFIGSQTYVMADGSKVPSARFIIRNLKVGDYTIQNVVGSVANVQGDLLLGQSFLQKFKRWSFNNADHTLDLEQ